jgi:hypothetical protein
LKTVKPTTLDAKTEPIRLLTPQAAADYVAADEPTKAWLRWTGLDIPDDHYENLDGEIVAMSDEQLRRSRQVLVDERYLLGEQGWL